MTDKKIFVDTNILVYAYDLDAGEKHNQANQIIKSLWNNKIIPGISIQVLQELYVNLIRKKVHQEEAREILEDYLNWDCVVNDSHLLLKGIEVKEKYRVSFWDGLIIAAAKISKAHFIWSEDLNHGQNYGGVIVNNPFLN